KELPNQIVELQPAVGGAANGERPGDRLRRAVELERRVGPDRDVALGVLPAERSFPVHGVHADARRGKPGNPGLNAERVEVVAETREEEVVGGAAARARTQRESYRERQQGPTHHHESSTRGASIIPASDLHDERILNFISELAPDTFRL